MAEIDKQKEKVTTFRNFLLTFAVSLFSMFAYLFNNYDKLSETKLIIFTISSVILVILIIIFTNLLIKSINKLKDL